MHQKKMIWIIMAILVLAVGSLAIFGGRDAEQQAKEPIRLGAVYPLSGAMALLGEESFRGAELAAKARNAKGGIGGRQIELVKADGPNAAATQTETNRLITLEGLKVIMGTFASSLSAVATEMAERHNVSYWELGAIADNITQRGFKYTFRTCPTASSFAEAGARFIEESLAPKLGVNPKDLRIAIMHEDGWYGSAVVAGWQAEAKKRGWNIVATQPYSATAVDLTSVVMVLKAAKPDVLVGVSYITDLILFWRQAKEMDFNVRAYIGNGAGHSLTAFQEAVGNEGVEGVFTVDFTQYATHPQFAVGIEEFVRLYQETYGHAPRSGHSLANYMGATVLFDVLEKAGSLDPEAIRKAALQYEKPAGTTPTGWGVKFDPTTNQNILALPNVAQWLDGKLVSVWPKGAAIAEFLAPMPTWAERAKR